MSKTSSTLARLARFAFAAFLAFAFAVAATPAKEARADDEAVRKASFGVLKFNWYIDGVAYSRGSCFLINNDTVLTAYHCTMFSTQELEANKLSGNSVQQLRDKMTYTVNVNRDMQIGAKLVNSSEEQDFAIFKLDQEIDGYTPLTFRDSSTVKAAEKIYSVGFPANSDLTAIQKYTPADATVKGGTVSKPEDIYQGKTSEQSGSFIINGYFIQSDCTISGGDSGGPMVDDNGNVVGIAVTGNNNYYLAVASDKVMEALKTIKVGYNVVDGSGNTTSTTTTDGKDTGDKKEEKNSLNFGQITSAISEAESKKAEEYTEESYKAMKSALDEATKVRDETKLKDETDKDEYEKQQKVIDDATSNLKTATASLQEKPKQVIPTWAIIAIVAGVAIIIGIIVAIVIANNNKKKKAAQNAQQQTQAAQPVQPAPAPAQPAHPAPAPAPAPAPVGDPATTVLDDGAEGTTILGEQIEGGTLLRMSNNEQIQITRSEMSIGRERKSVDYCLEGNGNIGRVHARIVVRDGVTYVVDNNSTNGTYVNNTKLRSGQEQKLNSGDIVKFADEKFKFTK